MTRRFSATQQSTLKDLQRIMGRISATSLRIEQDVMGGGVKVIFDRAGKRYVRECTRWDDSIDNLRAIGLQIDYLYRALSKIHHPDNGGQHEDYIKLRQAYDDGMKVAKVM